MYDREGVVMSSWEDWSLAWMVRAPIWRLTCACCLVLALLLALPTDVSADELIFEWTQGDFLHSVGGWDGSWWSSQRQEGYIMDGLKAGNPTLAPGYYRIVMEAYIDHAAGEKYQDNPILFEMSLYDELNARSLEWLRVKGEDEKLFRRYRRGSFGAAGKVTFATGSFFLGGQARLRLRVRSSSQEPVHAGKVWLFRNAAPDPGTVRVLTWNLGEHNTLVQDVGEALYDDLNAPDLAAIQELSYDEMNQCYPGNRGKENCILGVMHGYAGSSSSGLNLGDYGFSDGDLFDVYGIGNWQVIDWTGGHTDHYLGIISKKSVWPAYFPTYDYINKGVGEEGMKRPHWDFGTHNCSTGNWYAHDQEGRDCCGLPCDLKNPETCRTNYYFTTDHQPGSYDNRNGRHVTARFQDRAGKEGVAVTTHLVWGDGGDPGSLTSRREQMVDIIKHVAHGAAMYGPDYFDTHPLIILGDTNLRPDEQFKILDRMRDALGNAGADINVVDLTLDHGLEDVDTHPGEKGGDPDIDPYDKVYLLGSAAAMDNGVGFGIGTDLPLGFCATGHRPVTATLSTRTTDHVGQYNTGVGYGRPRYSKEPGETPAFDLKFEWGGSPLTLQTESRGGHRPVGGAVQRHVQGIEGEAATFNGTDHYLAYPAQLRYDASRRVTLQAWIKMTDLSGSAADVHTIVAKGTNQNLNYKLEVLGNGKVVFSTRDGGTGTWGETDGGLDTPVVGGVWHHVYASYDGLYGKIIVSRDDGTILEGKEEYLGANLALTPNDDPICIGAIGCGTGAPGNFFKGHMDDVQLYAQAAYGIHVDGAYAGEDERGTPDHPFDTVAEGHDFAWNGARIYIHAGSYPETLTLSQPSLLLAESGSVTIGH